jgi:hypothetical protein
VRAGDSLQSIAQNIYGDSSLWYKLAEANGLSGQSALFEGQSLRLPAGVIRNTYNADTITPYNPGETLGDVNPSTPQAAPPKKKKCGGVGTILMVIIAVAVTVATKGAASGFFKGVFAAGTGATAAVSAASASLALATTAASVAAGATAAVAGSIASQAFGVATGIQEKFDWKAVGMAAISGGLGAGASTGGNLIKQAASAMVRSAVTQGIGVTLGLQDKFSWAAVAAAGAGSAMGTMAGGMAGRASAALGGGKAGAIAAGVVTGMADAVGNAAAMSLIEGTDFGDNLRASLPSVLGNAIAGGLFSRTDRHAEDGPSAGKSLDALTDSLMGTIADIGRSLGGAVTSAATSIGDFLGFDGNFGYQGGVGWGGLSVANVGQAFRALVPERPVEGGTPTLPTKWSGETISLTVSMDELDTMLRQRASNQYAGGSNQREGGRDVYRVPERPPLTLGPTPTRGNGSLIDLNLIGTTDVLYTRAAVTDLNGYFTVIGHGNDSGTRIQDGQTGRLLDPQQLFDRMVANGWRQGDPVLLIMCNGGNTTAITSRNQRLMATELARLTGTSVVAPSALAVMPRPLSGYVNGSPFRIFVSEDIGQTLQTNPGFYEYRPNGTTSRRPVFEAIFIQPNMARPTQGTANVQRNLHQNPRRRVRD